VLSDRELAAEMSAKGLERAAQFSWEKCARQTVEVYRSVLGG
jgi:glycosyltransferase involved in cell wall biosynthesis